jgi:hypothetical protein
VCITPILQVCGGSGLSVDDETDTYHLTQSYGGAQQSLVAPGESLLDAVYRSDRLMAYPARR